MIFDSALFQPRKLSENSVSQSVRQSADMEASTAQFKKTLRGGEYIPTHAPRQPAASKSIGGTSANTERYILIPKQLQNLDKKPTLSLKIVLE